MTPTIYYHNLLALGVLSGTNTDEAYPVRRVADADLTLPWPIISGVGAQPGVISGEATVTLASGATRDSFVLAEGAGLSGFTIRVYSHDVDGGNLALHGDFPRASDLPFVSGLSGVTTPRRVWAVAVSGSTSGLAIPSISEMMLATRLDFPRRPQIGVNRATIHQASRIEIPGGAPFKFRLGDQLHRVDYSMIVEESALSGFETFLDVNDGGEFFWFADDLGDEYWAEVPTAEHTFDDQAGVYLFQLLVQEVPNE